MPNLNELERREILRLSNEESNRLTKECLQTALILLLKEKPLEKITITELVNRSGVSRSGFYRNYNTKEQLLDDICKELVNIIYEQIVPVIQKKSLNGVCAIFKTIKDNFYKFNILPGIEYIKDVFIKMEKLFCSKISLLNREEYYQIVANLGILSNLVVYWTKNNMEDDIEYMANLCMKFLI